MGSDDFTIGVEEEFQLVDPASHALHPGVDDVLPMARRLTSHDEVTTELHQTQIETGTPGLPDAVGGARRAVPAAPNRSPPRRVNTAWRIAAAGTHPSATADDGQITDKEAYRELETRYAHLAHEQQVFGCHVHVAITDRELAIATMNHIRPWLAPLLALSASSPFWEGIDTGYASYRTQVFGRWPTAGAPEPFASRAEFDDVVAQLIATESIDDPARIYWDVRPSAKYETLEVRVADACTTVDDAVMVAGLAGALVRQGAALAAHDGPAADRASRDPARRPMASGALRHDGRPRRRERPPVGAGRRRRARRCSPSWLPPSRSGARATRWPSSSSGCSWTGRARNASATCTGTASRSTTSSTG